MFVKLILNFFLYFCIEIYNNARSVYWRAFWRCHGVLISHNVTYKRHLPYAIQLAPGVSIGCGSILLATVEQSTLPVCASRLVVGEKTAINEYCNIRACGGEIRIGANCLLAQFVSVIASNHSIESNKLIRDQCWSETPNSVTIDDDVWIGAGATILPGAHIGRGSVIAAGSVVRGLVPSMEIWGGVPAKRIKLRL